MLPVGEVSETHPDLSNDPTRPHSSPDQTKISDVAYRSIQASTATAAACAFFTSHDKSPYLRASLLLGLAALLYAGYRLG
jgi:hypothetical protein